MKKNNLLRSDTIYNHCNVNPSLQQNNRIRLTLLVLSCGLLCLSAIFPTLWFVSFFALIPLLFVGTALNAFVVGTIYFLVVFYPLSTMNAWWWTNSTGFVWEHKQFVYLVCCLFLALFCSLLTFGSTFFLRNNIERTFSAFKNRDHVGWAILSILSFPFSWAALEFLRVKILFGLEWGLIGQSLGNNTIFARMAAWGGIYTLGFIVVLVNICLFFILWYFL